MARSAMYLGVIASSAFLAAQAQPNTQLCQFNGTWGAASYSGVNFDVCALFSSSAKYVRVIARSPSLVNICICQFASMCTLLPRENSNAFLCTACSYARIALTAFHFGVKTLEVNIPSFLLQLHVERPFRL
jgi:hypothetical protein